MATILQSQFITRQLPTNYGDCAGDDIVNDYFMDVTAAQIVAGDIIDMGILPAYHTVSDMILIPDDIDTNGTPTVKLDVGIMSSDPGDTSTSRTCGAEFFSQDTGAQTGAPARMSLKTGYLVKPTEKDRSIGVKFQTGAATAAAGRIRIRVWMRPADHTLQF